MNKQVDIFDQFGRIGVLIRVIYLVSVMFAFSMFVILFFVRLQTPSAQAQEPSRSADGLLIQNLQDRVKTNETQLSVQLATQARLNDNIDDMKVKIAEVSIELSNLSKTIWDLAVPISLIVVKELSDLALWFIARGKPRGAE